jgi:hypothetical protein
MTSNTVSEDGHLATLEYCKTYIHSYQYKNRHFKSAAPFENSLSIEQGIPTFSTLGHT